MTVNAVYVEVCGKSKAPYEGQYDDQNSLSRRGEDRLKRKDDGENHNRHDPNNIHDRRIFTFLLVNPSRCLNQGHDDPSKHELCKAFPHGDTREYLWKGLRRHCLFNEMLLRDTILGRPTDWLPSRLAFPRRS